MFSRRKCRHDNLRGTYGEEIVQRNFQRSVCLDCGRTFSELPLKVDEAENERLRDIGSAWWDSEDHAAEECEALQVTVERLRGALKKIARGSDPPDPLYHLLKPTYTAMEMRNFARDALAAHKESEREG